MYDSRKLTDSEQRKQLFTIFDSGHTSDPLDEILYLLNRIDSSIDENVIITIHQDIYALFKGQYPEIKENCNKYHDLRHTYAVVLATARLFHGLAIEGKKWTTSALLQGILSAYFHDTGLLLRSSDSAEIGAAYTRFHEIRSVQTLESYLPSRDFEGVVIKDCNDIINSTNIALEFSSLEFSSMETKRLAQIVASADVLAQMADRYYLEQLPHLYQERKAGGLAEHKSAFELMQDTAWFYHNVILKRLETVLGNAARSMKTHFKDRWNLDRDLYMENIHANISYLQSVISRCHDQPDAISQYLQRKPPAY